MPILLDFRNAKSVDDLATIVGCTAESLELVHQSPNRERFYYKHLIPKLNPRRAGECRLVYEAADWRLACIQKALLRQFEAFAISAVADYPHPACHGYVTGRSTLTNASQHLTSKLIVKADIQDYFPTITERRILLFLQDLGIAPIVAEHLTSLTTINGQLAQGIHTSPMFANLVSTDMDNAMSQLAKSRGATYTRYADDITFSSRKNNCPTKHSISEVLTNHGFVMADRKFRRIKRGQSFFVTGLSVANELRPRVPKTFKHKLRQELYYCDKFGILDHADRAGYDSESQCLNSLDGRISYLQGIEKTLGSQMRQQWMDLLERDNVCPTFANQIIKDLTNTYFFIDETEFELSGNQYLALALVSTHQPEHLEQVIDRKLDSILGDPYVTGRRKKLIKYGFHFTDNSIEVRTDFIKELSRFFIRSFVAFQRVADSNDKGKVYVSLLTELLRDRMLALRSYNCSICIEQQPVVSMRDIETAVADLRKQTIARRGNWFAKVTFDIRKGIKQADPCLCVADYTLGVFASYLKNPKDIERMWFERLRDKIRLIVNCDDGSRFHRKNPFVGLNKET